MVLKLDDVWDLANEPHRDLIKNTFGYNDDEDPIFQNVEKDEIFLMIKNAIGEDTEITIKRGKNGYHGFYVTAHNVEELKRYDDFINSDQYYEMLKYKAYKDKGFSMFIYTPSNDVWMEYCKLQYALE